MYDGIVESLGEGLVDCVVGRVNDGIPVLPLVPGRVPKLPDQSGYPLLGAHVVILKAALVERLSFLPLGGDEATEGILPTNGGLGMKSLIKEGIGAVTSGGGTFMPHFETI